ncbi:hypothetical protein CZ809_01187 [Photobacterium piscicola]|uniref:Uncharacterized protein n=1 Tax=Photobacterium piscicola TaxID=1378299 RepID=A0A1T5HY61_9GAMM|nr:hypothetical protein CZ809_01187 [Photobacterium piscicola]
MLCEMGEEVRRYGIIFVKLVMTESLGAFHKRLESKLIFEQNSTICKQRQNLIFDAISFY